MSRSSRRAISWIGTLAVLAAGGVGLAHLPGSGGTVDELRWLLAHSPRRPATLNQAFRVIYETNQRSSGAAAELLRMLLRDERLDVVDGALMVLARSWGYDVASDDADRGVFREWFNRASLDEKLAHIGAALGCCYLPLTEAQHTPSPEELVERVNGLLAPAATAWLAPDCNDVELSLTPEMQRWLVAGTIRQVPWQRPVAEMLTFRGWSTPSDMAQRLDFLDGVVGSGQTEQTWKPPVLAEAAAQQLWIDFDLLLLMLNDPHDQVRWGAGRILAVAGDARGLPAFCDWLQHNVRMSANADKLMTPLFGPDWRDLCASGSATRPSSPGDGGR